MNQKNAATHRSKATAQSNATGQFRLGPRGWAVLTLAGGAVLASPFLRPAELEIPANPAASSPGEGYPNAIENGLTDNFAEQPDWPTGQHVAASDSPSLVDAFPQRVVAGNLSATKQAPSQWPDWVRPTTRLDKLIAEGAVHAPSPPQGNWGPNPAALAPRQPWIHNSARDATPPMQSVIQSLAQHKATWPSASPFQSSTTKSSSPVASIPQPAMGASPRSQVARSEVAWPQADADHLQQLAERNRAADFQRANSPQGNFLPASSPAVNRGGIHAAQAGAYPSAGIGDSSAVVGRGRSGASTDALRTRQFVYQPGLQQ